MTRLLRFAACFGVFAALATAAASASTGGDPYSGVPDLMGALNFHNAHLNLGAIIQNIAGPIAFLYFAGNVFHAVEKAKQSQFNWHEMLTSGMGAAFSGVLLGGGYVAWSTLHPPASGAIGVSHAMLPAVLRALGS
jgi:hypothetical protein